MKNHIKNEKSQRNHAIIMYVIDIKQKINIVVSILFRYGILPI